MELRELCDAFLTKHVKPGNVVVLLARSLEAEARPVMERVVVAPGVERVPVAALLELLIAGLVSLSIEAGVTDSEFEGWMRHAVEVYQAILSAKETQH